MQDTGARLPENIIDKKVRQFNELSSFLEEWFYKPDIEALKICLAAYVAHTYLQEEAVWLFVIGASGSGKTSVAIRALEFLPNTHKIGNLTTKGFSSGFGKSMGILGKLDTKHNGNGVLLFPDFTTILSKDDRDLKDIAGQMRQIYDGCYPDWKGNNDEELPWKGKVTCIAAVTPALEDHWSLNRNLGERFMYLRWRSEGPENIAMYASKQIGHKNEIKDTFCQLVNRYVAPDDLHMSKQTKEIEEGVRGLAVLVSRLRTVVRREGPKRIIMSVDDSEMPSRVANAMMMIAIGSATLDRRANVDVGDLELAKRLAVDSIPRSRAKILKPLLDDFNYEMNMDKLREAADIPRASFDRTVEELVALKIIKVDEGANYTWVTMAQDMIRSWDAAIIANVATDTAFKAG